MPVTLTLSRTRNVILALAGPAGATLTLTTATPALVLLLATALRGERGLPGPAGEGFANLDGGAPDSNYGGLTAIDAGGP